MNYIVIGNIIALIASLLMLYSGYIKKKQKILFIQTIQIGLSVLSNVVLGGISGAIINECVVLQRKIKQGMEININYFIYYINFKI